MHLFLLIDHVVSGACASDVSSSSFSPSLSILFLFFSFSLRPLVHQRHQLSKLLRSVRKNNGSFNYLSFAAQLFGREIKKKKGTERTICDLLGCV